MKKILLIGPIPEPTTGVALANKVIIENIEKSSGFKIEYINTAYSKFEENHGDFTIDKALFFIKVNFEIYKIFRNDIIYITPGQTFFGVLKYFIFIITSKIFRKELILHIHGNYLRKQYEILSGIKKKVFFSIISLTDKGVVLSELLIGNMSPFIKRDRIYILHNFVEDYIIDSVVEVEKKLECKIPRIVYLSNLMEEKGIIDLLEAFIIMKNKGVFFEARIAGNIDVKFKNKFEEYLIKLESVKYLGIVKGKEKQDLLLWGNTFVLPTYYSMEGQPIAIIEAMATGNVVLTTNHAGIPDIFENEMNGFCVQAKSPESIVDKITFINNNIEFRNRICLNNIDTARKKYTTYIFIDNLIKIFKD